MRWVALTGPVRSHSHKNFRHFSLITGVVKKLQLQDCAKVDHWFNIVKLNAGSHNTQLAGWISTCAQVISETTFRGSNYSEMTNGFNHSLLTETEYGDGTLKNTTLFDNQPILNRITTFSLRRSPTKWNETEEPTVDWTKHMSGRELYHLPFSFHLCLTHSNKWNSSRQYFLEFTTPVGSRP